MDKLYVGGKLVASFCNVSVETRNTHGTGCTLSSAIASFLARGEVMVDADAYAASSKPVISLALEFDRQSRGLMDWKKL